MPMIKFDHDTTIRNIVQCFRIETGLVLEVFDDLEKAEPHMRLRDFLIRRYTFEGYRRIKSLVWQEHSPLIKFYGFNKIFNIKKIFRDSLGLDVEIYTQHRRLISGNTILYDVMPGEYRPRTDWGKIRILNRRLRTITEDILKEINHLLPPLKKRIRDRSDWLQDFEIEADVEYYLDRRDRNRHVKGELFFVQKLCVGLNDSEQFWNDPRDHNDWEPFNKKTREPHCWLLHDLYDHHCLPREDIQRIGDIWVDIRVWHQHHYREKKSSVGK